MQLSEQEKKEIRDLVERGEPLPDKYRFLLFKEPREAELIWPGKTHETTSAVLPFQSIEQIDEPRAEVVGGGASTRKPICFRSTAQPAGRAAAGPTS